MTMDIGQVIAMRIGQLIRLVMAMGIKGAEAILICLELEIGKRMGMKA